MESKEKQEKNKAMPCGRNSKGGVLGSYFSDEVYNFDGADDKLPIFVEMLKKRGYYIGADGHIRTPKKGTIASKLMRNGYYLVAASYDGKTYHFMEHRAIWVWYNGAIPEGLVINHKDYNRANNLIENLELMTQKENIAYSKCHQNPPIGEKSGKAKYSNKQAQAIKTLANVCGWKIKDIAAFVEANTVTIGRVVNGKRYPNVISATNILEVYPTLVNFTRNKELSLCEELKDYLLGLNGEIGELTDLFKKILYHGKDINKVDIMNELGDVLYYLVAICNVLGFDCTEILLNNNAKLLSRYPNGFSCEASENRIEEQ